MKTFIHPMMEMFHIMTILVVTLLNTSAKTHQILNIKVVTFIVLNYTSIKLIIKKEEFSTNL